MTTSQFPLLGNENAELDNLLLDCKVDCQEHDGIEKNIIIGRWGTGKTAYMLLRGETQEKKLEEISSDARSYWYLTEASLNADQLGRAKSGLNNPKRFARYLEHIWEAEILRRTIVILNTLNSKWEFRGSDWELIANIAKREYIADSVWHHIPSVFLILSRLDLDQKPTGNEVIEAITCLFLSKTKVAIGTAIGQLEKAGHERPLIAIEPIETPDSSLESEANNGLSGDVVAALLNKFQSDFQPDPRVHKPRVMISVPWHRYDPTKLNLPQKIRQYEAHMAWTKERLKNFIDMRIEWEFGRVERVNKRSIKDYWHELFGKEIINDYCDPNVKEDTFEYILMHTNYRPRELQRLTRRAIELWAAGPK
jgi:hypothetical protein